MSKNIFNEMTTLENIQRCYHKCLCGDTKYNSEAMIFSLNETYNLKILQKELITETYIARPFIEFYVYEPKKRVINAPHFRDKIVQRMTYEELSKIYNPTFIKDSYASIKGRGMHGCLEQIHHYLKKAKWEYGDDAYIIKADIKKFFYSIDREVLKDRLLIKIKGKKLLRLLFSVIDQAEHISDKGLPLGNTSSQVFANILMDKLDKYCKCKLGIKYYCRYMDDIFIVVENKNKAKEYLGMITAYTNSSLHLQMNEKKTKIFPINQGINMVGFKIQTTHRLLRSESKNNMKRKMKKLEKLYMSGQIGKEKVEQIMNSWYGHAKHGNCYNLINNLIDKNNIYKIENEKIVVRGE